MAPAYFISGPGVEGSSGPIITRQVALSDVWPEGLRDERLGGNKDILADGKHPALAVGAKGNRPENMTGVVLSYNAAANLIQLNVADKYVSHQYVANVLTYANNLPATFDISMGVGDPVYVDDSDPLTAGVTLSRSPLNLAGEGNPLVGYLFYCQDEYQDYGVGGPNHAAIWPKIVPNALDESEYCVIHVDSVGYNRTWPRAQ